MKKQLITLAFSLFALSAIAQMPNTLSKKEKKKGWILLFDGKTTKGWHTYNKPTASEAWQIKDDALVMNAAADKTQRGDLTTDEEYENYDFSIDWKISKNGNSGVIFNVVEDPKYSQSYFTGPEMQVLDSDGHPDGKIIKHRTSDLYDLITSSPETVKPVGEWNTAKIVQNRGLLQFYLNGTKVMETRTDDENWKTMIAGSKFKNMPAFGKSSKGHLCLQDHGNEVWYRNIKIRKL